MGKQKWINVTRSSMPTYEEYVEAIRPLWESRWLTNMGPYHQELEQRLREFLDVPEVSLTVNGHMALELALQAMEFPEGSEVITTPFTFASTTHAIVRNGLVPVFCDINPVEFTIDERKIESLITERTRAIFPVHVYGNVCNVDEIGRIAGKYGLKVIYDSAHAFGVKYRGKGIASFGDISCFSFHATKVFHTIEGGAACFSDKEIGLRIYYLKNFGIRDAEHVDGVGANAKMNEFAAIMGICNLRHIHETLTRRKAAAERYRKHLEGIPGVQLNHVQKDVEPNYAYFPVVFDESTFGATRDVVIERLRQHGIGARKYFYPLTSAYECFHGMYAPSKTPVAFLVSQRVLTLPLYANLLTEDVDRICEIVLACRNS